MAGFSESFFITSAMPNNQQDIIERLSTLEQFGLVIAKEASMLKKKLVGVEPDKLPRKGLSADAIAAIKAARESKRLNHKN